MSSERFALPLSDGVYAYQTVCPMQHDCVPGSSGGWTVAPTFQPVSEPSSLPSAAAFAKSSFGTVFGAKATRDGARARGRLRADLDRVGRPGRRR